VATADRASLLVDGEAYFRAFRDVAKVAHRSLLIVGWDIDSRFELLRERPTDDLPTALGEFLNSLVRRNKHLHVHIIDWDYPVIFAPGREWLSGLKLDWSSHRRVHFHMDKHHPVGASHHQKIVVIDDQVAFVGGLDFTLGRWDTPEHKPDDERRRDLNGDIRQPYHDVQLMVSGPIAKELGNIARGRWHTATGRKLAVPSGLDTKDLWPNSVPVEIADAPVGVACTVPKFADQTEIRDVEHLVLDAIAAARHSIYIENQYFTATRIGDALAKRLTETQGPEIVVLLPQHTVGWLSQNTMDVLRERLIRRLNAVDHHNRLRVYSLHVADLGEQCINLHSKVLIIDDQLLRVGSANFNNRSMGLDTECDLAIEARDETRIRSGINGMRNRLLAEHLNVTQTELAKTITQQGSLIPAIEALISSGRSLKPFEFRVTPEWDALVPDAEIADPGAPMDADQVARELVNDDEKPRAKRTLLLLASVLIAALVLAAIWRWTPLSDWIDFKGMLSNFSSLRGDWLAWVIIPGIYILAGLIAFPVTLLIAATGLAFGAYYGFLYALLGTELSAIVTYLIGHQLGHDRIKKLSSPWIKRVSHRLARQGLLAIIILRIVPVAPFSIINLVAGASHIRARDFALGTLLGITPATLALTAFSSQVLTAIQTPDPGHITLLLGLAFAIGLGAWALSRWLLRRQNTPFLQQ
jgi:phosphatidylserine/phosphatidylglycerophosphate/cardiolipin synthase-like enzyme/uncharacterized membrane protein YdjX (TVP38/TMEM64 family)